MFLTHLTLPQSASEIDRGYAVIQSYLTWVLLGISTLGLAMTLCFLLPAAELRKTRSAKINVCFTLALILASTVFLIQDLFIKADNSGLIKLVSV